MGFGAPVSKTAQREGGSGAERRQLSDQPQEFLLLLFRKTAGFVELGRKNSAACAWVSTPLIL